MGGSFIGYSLDAAVSIITCFAFKFWTPPRYSYRGFLLLQHPGILQKTNDQGSS